MNTTQIITSLLDTDLYKLTMMQCILHQFPSALVEYRFKCRNKATLAPLITEIKTEIKALCKLSFTEDELNYLQNFNYFQSDFITFLRSFQLNESFIHLDTHGDDLEIKIKGPWLHTIMFETPVLAIINEIYCRHLTPTPNLDNARERLAAKIEYIQQIPDNDHFIFSDFGTRRRFSKTWQIELNKTLKDTLPLQFYGTSNIYIAKLLGIFPLGTMAHEYLQASQAIAPQLKDSQRFALDAWHREYQGELGIALTDVINTDIFLQDFDLPYALNFTGLRHDSGDPIVWGEKVIQHYANLNINPKTKTLIFSDSLNVEKAAKIYAYFKDQTRCSFGIGTNLTNDCGDYQPLNIVIKMTKCNGQSVAKISDSPGKSICQDQLYIDYLKKMFQI